MLLGMLGILKSTMTSAVIGFEYTQLFMKL